MADLDHNLSLADALTEPPHDVEEEVKRDFIATLEAEKFDDVVGETVDKTDYVPLLDDEDEGKAGSQEPKGKGHVDGIPVEHSSASGPMVVENGDHGLQDHRTAFPGEIMDEKMSYKEFLDRNDSWSAEERELCFKPMDMAEPFAVPRGEELPALAFPAEVKNAPLFPGHAAGAILAPHGSMMGPEQPFLGSMYSPAEALDPSAFIGLESGTEFLPGKAAPEEYWMGAQQDMKGPDTSFFVEPPVPPAATEAIRTSLPESPTAAAAPGSLPAAAPALPGEAGTTAGAQGPTAGAASVPAADAASLPAEKAGDTKPPPVPGAGAAPAAAANPFQATDGGFSPAPEAGAPKGVNDVSGPGTELGFALAADAGSHHGVDLGFGPAAALESHQTVGLGFAPAACMESYQAMDLGFAPAACMESHQAMDLGFSPAAGMESHHAMDLGFSPAAGMESHHAMDLGFSPAAGMESHHAMDLGFAPAADAEPHHALDLGFAPAADSKAQHVPGSEFGPAAEVNHHHGLDSGFAPAAPAKPVPVGDAGKVSVEAQPDPAAAPRIAVSGELLPSQAAPQQDKAPAEATAKVEAESKAPEVCVDHSEKMKDKKPPPDEHLPGKTNLEAAAEAKGAVENKDLPGKSAPAENGETQKEEAEHNHIQHTEPQEGKTPLEPTGLPTAQVRQAPKSRDRGFGRAKAAPVPLTDVPEEHPVGVPQQKSPEPRADPCSTVELGCGAGTSPRFRAPPKNAAGVPTEPGRSCRDPPQENWDLESAAVKKRKKKPKQRRSQLPRGMEFWDEKGTASRGAGSAPSGAWGWPSADGRPGTAAGNRALDVPRDAERTAGSHVLDEQKASPGPAPAERAPKSGASGAGRGREMKAEGSRDDGWVLECEGKSREVPWEHVGKAEAEESAAAKRPTEATERDIPKEKEKREDKESKGADLTVDVGKAETPLKTKPLELPLPHKNKEPKTPSPGQEAPGDSVHQPSPEAEKNWEKSKGVEKESLKQPHLEAAAVEDKLPAEPKAAGESKTASEGGLKTPGDAPGAPVSPKPGGVAAVQAPGAEGAPRAPERGSPGEAGARGVAADCPAPNQGKGFSPCEERAGKDPGWTHGGDRPKKKRSEGKGKRMKSFPEQMMLSEDGGKFTAGGRVDEAGKERVCPENGQGVPARGHPSASAAQACATDKPKKRGSDGRSKKGERSFSQQPFPENKTDAGSSPEAKVGSDKGREGGCVPAGGLQENAAKMQRPTESGAEQPKENGGKGETADLGALDQALLLEKSREEAKTAALAATSSPTKQVGLVGQGREAGGCAGLAEQARKRSSDGRRKRPEKSPSGQAAVLGAGGESRQEQEAGSRKEKSLDQEQGSGLLRERELAKAGIQGGFSEQPNLSGHKAEISEPETGSAKETGPVNKGKEAEKSQPLPEPRAGMHSPTRELGMDKAKSKSRDGKGKKAEPSAELQVGDLPAVGPVQQTQSEKGKENSRTPGALPGPLPDPAKVQTPALPLEPGKSPPGGEEKHKKGEPDPQQPFLLELKAGAGMFSPPGLEIRDKPEAGGASPCSRNANLIPEHPAVSDPSPAPVTERSKKKGYDGSSKKAKNASRQPVPLEAKPGRSEAQAPVGAGLECGMPDTDFVDENRNITNFPTGPQRLGYNRASDFKSVSQATASGPGDGGDPCGLPKQREGGEGTGGLPPPHPPPPLEAGAEKSSREPGAGAKEMQTQQSREQPVTLGHKEPGKEVPQRDGNSREDGQPKDKSHLSPVAKVDHKEIKAADKEQNAAKVPSELPQPAADPKHRAASGAAMGTGGPEATLCCAEKGTGSLSPAPAGTPGSTGSLSPDRATRNEQSSAQPRDTEAAGLHGTAAQSTPKPPRESSKGPCQAAEGSPARAGEALLKDAPVAQPGVDKPQSKTKEKDSRDTKKEREPQGTTKEKERQEVTIEKESQDTTKGKGSQEITKEKESQDITKEKESQEIMKEKESQDITKEKESQGTTKEKESQEVTKEKESQDTRKEKESQEITKEKESQDITKEKESQDTRKEKESKEITKEKESQDTAKEKETQEIPKEKESQNTAQAKACQAAAKGREEEAKRERVKAAEQLKGYMRPTKARGLAAPPARPAPGGGVSRGVCVPRCSPAWHEAGGCSQGCLPGSQC